ncbi:MAG: acyltransferase [Pelomonas sp.]|nr:acyltransferase [Roseateles sp.]
MGLLRLLLAAAVVFAHTPVHNLLTGGRLAVESFFMISGFYVALVLDRTYRQPRDFYINRYLRLVPVYLVVAGASLLSWTLYGVKPFPESALPASDWGSSALGFLLMTNATMFFQDMTMFMCAGGEGLSWVADFRSCSPPLYGALLVPQAWSLGIEISFYALAPWLLRMRTRWVVALALASVAVKVVLYFQGFKRDPWDYRFFPSELFLFLLGSLAYRWRDSKQWLSRDAIPGLKVWGLLAFGLAFSRLPFASGFYFVFLAALFFSLPALLAFSNRHAWDRKLGELSYPLYMVHVLAIAWLEVVIPGDRSWGFAWLAVGVSLVASAALYRFVDVPMERVRSARRRNAAPVTTEVPSAA